jgi:hypothetical protein
VAVTPGIDFGDGAEGFIRFSNANSLDNIRKGMDYIYHGHIYVILIWLWLIIAFCQVCLLMLSNNLNIIISQKKLIQVALKTMFVLRKDKPGKDLMVKKLYLISMLFKQWIQVN